MKSAMVTNPGKNEIIKPFKYVLMGKKYVEQDKMMTNRLAPRIGALSPNPLA